MARPRPRALVLALVALATVAIVAFAVMPNGLFRGTTSNPAAPTDQTAQEPDGQDAEGCKAGDGGEAEDADAAERCELGYFDPRKEAKFERTVGEAALNQRLGDAPTTHRETAPAVLSDRGGDRGSETRVCPGGLS